MQIIPSLIENIKTHGDVFRWAFIPCNGKIPLDKGWPSAPPATHGQCDQWAAQGYNIGLRTGQASGVVVVDIDDPRVAPLDNFPPTVTAVTKNGYHLYYRSNTNVKNDVKVLPGVDIRGDGGQVVFPGSKHPDGGEYRWMERRAPGEIEFADFPAHMFAKPAKPEKKPAPKKGTHTIGRCIDSGNTYLQGAVDSACDIILSALEGERNATLNKETHGLAGYQHANPDAVKNALLQAAIATGLPQDEAQATLQSAWAAGSAKPREIPKRKHNILSWVFTMAAGEGCSVPAEFATHGFFDVIDMEEDTQGCWRKTRSEITPRKTFEYLSFDGLDEPEPDYPHLFESAIPTDCISFLAAEGGLGKTFFAFQIACSLGSGRQVFDSLKPVNPEGIRVLYFEGETPKGVMRRRIKAFYAQRPNVFNKALRDNLRIIPNHPGHLGQQRSGNLEQSAFYADVMREVEQFDPALIIFDTLATFGGFSENDNTQANAYLSLLKQLLSENRAMLILHHLSKAANSGQGTTSSGMARGASALIDGARFCWIMTRQDERIVLENTKATCGRRLPPIFVQQTDGGVLQEIAPKPKDDPKRQVLDIVIDFLQDYDGAEMPTLSKMTKGKAGDCFSYLRESIVDKGLQVKDLKAALNFGCQLGELQIVQKMGGNKREFPVYEVTKIGKTAKKPGKSGIKESPHFSCVTH